MSINYSAFFLRAGWRRLERRTKGGLVILERVRYGSSGDSR